jgi:hypothetical protein
MSFGNMRKSISADRLFRRRIIALKKAKLRARDPEFQDIWEIKIQQLIRNEKVRLGLDDTV